MPVRSAPAGGGPSEGSLRILYGELAKGRLDRYLDTNPEVVNPATAQAVTSDFEKALEYGDVATATATVRVAAEILVRIGERQLAIAYQLRLFDLQLETAGTSQDYAALRRWALVAGVRAQDAHWPVGQAECLFVAAESARRMAESPNTDPEPAKEYLITALRDLADVGDLILEYPRDPKWRDSLARLAHLLGICSEAAYRTAWEEHELLTVRATLRRCARNAERVVPRGFAAGLYPDAREEAAATARLTRLLKEFAV